MSSRLPSRSEAWARLRASDPPDWVLEHCACVEAQAVAMARQAAGRGYAIDEDLVSVGAALHDIGRSVLQGPSHAHVGAQMLRADGWPEAVARIVERHTGAGLTADDAHRIGIPVRDYIPVTLEEKLVGHADNLYSGAKRQTMAQVTGKYEAKGLPEALARIEALHAELTDVLGMDPGDVEPASLQSA